MNQESLKRGNAIQDRIKVLKLQINRAEYTQADDITPRIMRARFIGHDEDLILPASIWRVVGKLVLAEYQEELRKLEIEFEQL